MLKDFMKEVYCLRENPFSADVAPEPNSKMWCFVNRRLLEGESSVAYLGPAIHQFVARLVNGESGKRGLMVIGWWGSGKSHALNAVIRECKNSGFRTCKLDFRKHDVLAEMCKGKEDPLNTLLAIAYDRLKVTNVSPPAKTVLCLDQAENLPVESGFGWDAFKKLMDEMSFFIEDLTSRTLSFGIVITQTPETYKGIKDWRSYVKDRFDRCVFPEDMSEIEAQEVVKTYLRLVRIRKRGLESMSDLHPFTSESIEEILGFWRKGLPKDRTMREFIKKCRLVLDYSVEKRLKEISRDEVQNSMHSLYALWKKLPVEWETLRNAHTILLYSVYNALDRCKDHSDVNLRAVHPEFKKDVNSGSVRMDIYAIPTGKTRGVAVEIQTSSSISTAKYQKFATLISRDELAGVVAVCLDENIRILTEKVLTRTMDPTKYRALRIEREPEILGELLSFATLSPHLGFPSEAHMSDRLRRNIRKDDMVALLSRIGLLEAIKAIP
ncbi:MAG: hypothetical protein ACUVTD_04290 [Nitrososphaerales archaeon]